MSLFQSANKALVALVALALLIAASDPGQKELVVKLIVNLLMEGEESPAG